MSELIKSLITDRSGTDVLHWQALRNKGYAAMTDAEREEWNAGNMKGAYNVSDLNRVGEALNYMRDRLAEASYISPYAFTAKTDWKASDIPIAADLTYYLNCVRLIRRAFTFYKTTPIVPADTGALNHEEANNIEKVLIDVFTLLENMQAARLYCGDIFSGDV